MIASANKPLALKRRALSQTQLNQHNFSLGQRGETVAAAFLEKQGYQILAQNIRWKNHEVDLVALDRAINEVVFVEVKTRGQSRFGDATGAINQQKLHSMQKVAEIFLKREKLDLDYRFDIITVISGKIQHYLNVTWGRRR